MDSGIIFSYLISLLHVSTAQFLWCRRRRGRTTGEETDVAKSNDFMAIREIVS
jgi:hypothetical protein